MPFDCRLCEWLGEGSHVCRAERKGLWSSGVFWTPSHRQHVGQPRLYVMCNFPLGYMAFLLSCRNIQTQWSANWSTHTSPLPFLSFALFLWVLHPSLWTSFFLASHLQSIISTLSWMALLALSTKPTQARGHLSEQTSKGSSKATAVRLPHLPTALYRQCSVL